MALIITEGIITFYRFLHNVILTTLQGLEQDTLYSKSYQLSYNLVLLTV